MVSVLLDTVVALLLGATILFAIRLDRRLNALRQGRGEMQALLMGIQDMTMRAEAGIAQFKAAATDGGAELETQVRAAEALRGDLAMLIERAERAAERIQETTRTGRAAEIRGLTPVGAERPQTASRTPARRATEAPAEAAPATETAFVKALRRAR
ncbi:MAG: DUF6468 domain-containing protein [Alphaproteobacteria bacterium]